MVFNLLGKNHFSGGKGEEAGLQRLSKLEERKLRQCVNVIPLRWLFERRRWASSWKQMGMSEKIFNSSSNLIMLKCLWKGVNREQEKRVHWGGGGRKQEDFCYHGKEGRKWLPMQVSLYVRAENWGSSHLLDVPYPSSSSSLFSFFIAVN